MNLKLRAQEDVCYNLSYCPCIWWSEWDISQKVWLKAVHVRAEVVKETILDEAEQTTNRYRSSY